MELELDGEWTVKRTGGWLPPLVGVSKQIQGGRGATKVGRLLRVPFRVEGGTLRYLPPFAGFVDLLEPDGVGFRGTATYRGREFGRFVLRRQ